MEHEVIWCLVGLAVGSLVLSLLAMVVHPRQLRGLRPRFPRPGRLVRGCVVGGLLLAAAVFVGLAWLLG
ncbi:MAG: hypothetical protein HC884_06035 [Chloroflexaceae bacterium]|nr:hypothetical protein [Chloroflexaceae bacterium]